MYNEPFVLTPPPVKPKLMPVLKRRSRATRVGRQKPYGHYTKHHFHLLTCPHCGGVVASEFRMRHTYHSLRTWLQRSFALIRVFNKGKRDQYTIHDGGKPWKVVG